VFGSRRKSTGRGAYRCLSSMMVALNGEVAQVWKYKEGCLAAGRLGLVDEPSKHDDHDCRGSDQVTRVLDSGRLCFPCTWDLRDRTGLSRCPLDGGSAPNVQANSGDCAEEYRHGGPIIGTVSGAWGRLSRPTMGIGWGLVWARLRLNVESAVRHGRSRPSCEPRTVLEQRLRAVFAAAHNCLMRR
jgi:hypothetical protein